MYVRGPFERFVDLPHYSESELCGGAVTVSFSKYLPWQAMHFLQRFTHFSKTCCRPFAASFRRIVEQAVLTSELPLHGWQSPEITWDEIWDCMADVLMGFHRSTFSKSTTEFSSDLAPCDFWELQGKKFLSDQQSSNGPRIWILRFLHRVGALRQTTHKYSLTS
jgi:hypothetical protein